MVGAFAYADVVLMESFIAGTELAVGVFERSGDILALSAVEIVPEGELYDYSARYTAGPPSSSARHACRTSRRWRRRPWRSTCTCC
jgi:D-alanine-D-alanine ligase-like ATP-grasp enzyme